VGSFGGSWGNKRIDKIKLTNATFLCFFSSIIYKREKMFLKIL